jgi:hypothetical protein
MAAVLERSRAGSDDADGAPSHGMLPRQKSSLVLAAEQAGKASFGGYLRKLNSQQQWQKRYFEVVGGRYWVYRKSSAPTAEILCAMDLWKSGPPALLDVSPHGDAVFSIEWDRLRLFRASNREEAQTWVRQMRMAQANRPQNMAKPQPGLTAVPAFSAVGGVLHVASAPSAPSSKANQILPATSTAAAAPPSSSLPPPAPSGTEIVGATASGASVQAPSVIAANAATEWGAVRPPKQAAAAHKPAGAACCALM